MEAGKTDPKYLTTMTFVHSGEVTSIEDARMEAEKLLDCARGHGLVLVDGDTGLIRERDALESFSYGSEDVLRNRKAERREFAASA